MPREKERLGVALYSPCDKVPSASPAIRGSAISAQDLEPWSEPLSWSGGVQWAPRSEEPMLGSWLYMSSTLRLSGRGRCL